MININVNDTDVKVGIPAEERVYVILTAVTSGLSVIGGSLICAIYFLFKDMQTPSRKLLLFVAFSDALLALGNFLGIVWFLYSDSDVINKSKAYCAFQSAMTIYFSYTSFFWTVTMALCLFMAVVMSNGSFTATYMKLFHFFAWVPMGIILIVALAMDVLGTDTTLKQASWCWIDPRTPNTLVWQLTTGKLFEMVAYVTTVVLYTAIRIFLGKQASKKQLLVGRRKTKSDVIAEANRKLMFVPLVFIICRIWGTLRFLLGNFAQDVINEPYVTWINPLQGIGDSAQGFANFVLYCFSTERIRRRIRRYFCPKSLSDDNYETGLDSVSRIGKKSTVGIAATGESELDSKEAGIQDVVDAKTYRPKDTSNPEKGLDSKSTAESRAVKKSAVGIGIGEKTEFGSVESGQTLDQLEKKDLPTIARDSGTERDKGSNMGNETKNVTGEEKVKSAREVKTVEVAEAAAPVGNKKSLDEEAGAKKLSKELPKEGATEKPDKSDESDVTVKHGLQTDAEEKADFGDVYMGPT